MDQYIDNHVDEDVEIEATKRWYHHFIAGVLGAMLTVMVVGFLITMGVALEAGLWLMAR
jgi:hypothetical protein